MLKIAVMGHGVVGSGVAEVFYQNKKSIENKAGEQLDIKYILDLRDFEGLPYSDKFIKDFNIILNDSEVKIVVEVMGGITFAYEYVKKCLMAGKSVVSSNKELVAEHGAELLNIAFDNNVNFLFEASVGGGIPILRPLSQCLAANEITEISGILNGTTNFILNKMINDGADFKDALDLAQSLGYAEKDPTADVEGHDACRKICILASLAFGSHVYPKSVYTEGITKITAEDVIYADMAGYAIKLIGKCKKLDSGKIFATVYPCFVPKENMLSHVNGVMNAVLVTGNAVGETMFYGPGAGKYPTASAVIADIVDCAKHINKRKYLDWNECSGDFVVDHLDEKVKMYIRTMESKEKIKHAFPSAKILASNTTTAFITDEMVERDVISKIKNLKVLSSIRLL